MPRRIGPKEVLKWRAYLSEVGSKSKLTPLTDEIIRKTLTALSGELVSPARKDEMTATVREVRDNEVTIRRDSGKENPVSFREICDADKVLRYWLAKKKAPIGKDFENPHPDIGVQRIFQDSYAPALAERIRGTRLFSLPEEVQSTADFAEGSVQRILVNKYERDPRARQDCIDHHGAKCHVCQFDFVAVYGAAMTGFIHVHHLKPLASCGKGYRVDPVRDLRPVCPNCHAVIHRREPPYSLDEVRQLLESRTETGG